MRTSAALLDDAVAVRDLVAHIGTFKPVVKP